MLILEHTLDPVEIGNVQLILHEASTSELDPRSQEYYGPARHAASCEAPHGDPMLKRLSDIFRQLRERPGAAGCLIHGFPVDDTSAGPTPAGPSGDRSLPAPEYEHFLAWCSMQLGEPFSWLTLQSGALVQDILPVKGDEERQSGHGSLAFLELHNEDAFHAERCDFLVLFGVRNHDRVPTFVASVNDLDLPDEVLRLLCEPRFLIRPDDEHIRQLERSAPKHPALECMRRMRDSPSSVRILEHDDSGYQIQFDRPFTDVEGSDSDAARALDALMAELERNTVSVVVGSGSVLVVDNRRAVHGRQAFRSRYDGTDRWLLRMMVHRHGAVADPHIRIRY